jgi:hypothetical protein
MHFTGNGQCPRDCYDYDTDGHYFRIGIGTGAAHGEPSGHTCHLQGFPAVSLVDAKATFWSRLSGHSTAPSTDQSPAATASPHRHTSS